MQIKFTQLFLVAAFFFGAVTPLNFVEAKSVMGEGSVIIEYMHQVSPVPGDCISSIEYQALDGGGDITYDTSATYIVNAYDAATNALITEGATVAQGSQIRFDITLDNAQTSWFENGRSYDSPNGVWVDNLPAPAGGCINGFLPAQQPWHNVYFKRPSINYNHSGSSAAFSCNGNGSLCTVTSSGTLATSIDFSPGSFVAQGQGLYMVSPVSPSYWAPTGGGIAFAVPTLTYPINVAGPSNQAPNPPTITGPTSGAPGTYTFTLSATDPDGNPIRYGLDDAPEGAVSPEQYRPTSGYVASGSSQTVDYTFSTPGTYTFRAQTLDNQGGVSASWTSHTITIASTDCLVQPPSSDSIIDNCANSLGYSRPRDFSGAYVINKDSTYVVCHDNIIIASQVCDGGEFHHSNQVPCRGSYSACTNNPVVSSLNFTINGSTGPLEVSRGTSLNLSWNATNVTACYAYGAGWGSATPIALTGTATIPANQSDSYIVSCTTPTGNISRAVQVTLSNTLKVCQNSCASGIQRTSFSLAQGGSQNLVACFNSYNGCTDPSGNVTSSATWNETNSPNNATTITGTDPKTLTGITGGVENTDVSYSGQNQSLSVSVTCVPTVSCANAPGKDNYCQNETFSVDNGCGVPITCNGTKTCDLNWKEVAP